MCGNQADAKGLVNVEVIQQMHCRSLLSLHSNSSINSSKSMYGPHSQFALNALCIHLYSIITFSVFLQNSTQQERWLFPLLSSIKSLVPSVTKCISKASN